MKASFAAVAIASVLFAGSRAAGEELALGPPASPLSWTLVLSRDSRPPALPYSVALGTDASPDSIACVELFDMHPFGESERNTVWLARHDSITVNDSTGVSSTVTLYSAFTIPGGELLAAFTAPAPEWIRSKDERWRIDTGWRMAPRRTVSKSTVLDVLELVLPQLKDAGQIILRPRYSSDTNFVGEPPFGDVWVVEVLGKNFEWRSDRPQKTRGAYLFRDGSLEFLCLGFAP
jgi:hypothetical protein